MDTGDEWYHRFVKSFPLVQHSRQLIKDNPWITKVLKINIMHINRLYNSQLLRPVRQQPEYNTYKDLLRRCLKEAETNYYHYYWFPSRSSVLIYICMCIPYMSSVIGRNSLYIYNGSVIQYWRSCTPSRFIGLYFWGVRGSLAECQFLFSLVYQLCLALW